uniref:Uncharacterized protein n=1 Tax=Strigamia maritima TaxID=126957 RepID=T1IY74_STRMM
MANCLLSNELPPTYDEACGSITASAPIFQTPCPTPNLEQGFCAVDILPKKSNNRFQNLIDSANEWLRANPEWKVKNCETIKYSSNVGGNPDTRKVTFSSDDTFMRCLRLWLVPQSVPSPISLQINYFNEIPSLVSTSKHPPIFEDLTILVKKLNDRLRFQPIDGRIVSVESVSVPVNVSKHQSDWIDPDKLFFVECDVQVIMFRVFYICGPKSQNIIEIRDYTPKCIYSGKYENVKHESFADLVQQAALACRGTQILNIQTLPKSEANGNSVAIIAFLRVVILIQSYSDPFSCFTNELMSKTFLPIQLTRKVKVENWNEPPKFQSVQMTLKHINMWARENNVKLIAAETCAMQMYPRVDDVNGPQSTDIYRSNDKNWIWIIRVFVDGIYPDPQLLMCPIAHRGWSNKQFLEDETKVAQPADSNCKLM